jgi:hypothetical protein
MTRRCGMPTGEHARRGQTARVINLQAIRGMGQQPRSGGEVPFCRVWRTASGRGSAGRVGLEPRPIADQAFRALRRAPSSVQPIGDGR